MSLLPFFQWCENSGLIVAMRSSKGLFPAIESIHLMGLALTGGAVLMLDLRLLGAAMRRIPVSEVAGRLRPWTLAGFLLMIGSGALLFYANPSPRYQNIFFRTKMVMLVLAGVNAWVFHRTVYRSVADWDLDPVPPRRARVAGGLALVLWAALIMSGRMIAYDWFNCGRQPQPAIVNVLAGCVTDSR